MHEAIESGESSTGIALKDAVTLLRTALAIVRQRTRGELGITLVKADVHLKLEWRTELSAGVGGKLFFVIPVETVGSRTSNATHDLTLSLRPKQSAADLGKPETEELAEAIIDLAKASTEIRKSVAADFDLDTFAIAVDVGVSRTGKLQVVAGVGDTSSRSHTIDVTFRPR